MISKCSGQWHGCSALTMPPLTVQCSHIFVTMCPLFTAAWFSLLCIVILCPCDWLRSRPLNWLHLSLAKVSAARNTHILCCQRLGDSVRGLLLLFTTEELPEIVANIFSLQIPFWMLLISREVIYPTMCVCQCTMYISRPVSVDCNPVQWQATMISVRSPFFCKALCFRIFWYFRAMHCSLAVWQPVTSDNDFGVVYDSDYNAYSVVLPDK